MVYRISTSNERVWCTTKLATLSFNHSIGRTHSWRFVKLFTIFYIYDMVADTQFHKFYGRPFARVLYLFLMKDIDRSVTPLGVTRVNRTIYKDDIVHNHSAHGCYITRMEGGVRYARYCCCYMLNRIKQNGAKTAIHIILRTIVGSGYISYERLLFEWWGEQNRYTYLYDIKTQKLQVRGTPYKCYSRSQQRSSPGLRLGLTPLLVFIECVWWISHSLITSSAFDIYDKAHFTHLGWKKLQARAIFIKQYSQPYFHAVSCVRWQGGDTEYPLTGLPNSLVHGGYSL